MNDLRFIQTVNGFGPCVIIGGAAAVVGLAYGGIVQLVGGDDFGKAGGVAVIPQGFRQGAAILVQPFGVDDDGGVAVGFEFGGDAAHVAGNAVDGNNADTFARAGLLKRTQNTCTGRL